MRPRAAAVALALNVGSSSVKFAVFRRKSDSPASLDRAISGEVSRIGLRRARFRASGPEGPLETPTRIPYRSAPEALDGVFTWLAARPEASRVEAIGHRVVHGGARYRQPIRLSPPVLRGLRRLVPLDPEHLPSEIRCIESSLRRFPRALQVACFDTSFHRTMLPPARRYGIPRALARSGVVRYGFHGLSYASIARQLRDSNGGRAPRRLIVAHLGSGASLCAIQDGRSLDTTMGFSPAGGLVMSRRSGDVDPNVVVFAADARHRSPRELRRLFNEESGLLGVSGRSSDMADLLRAARSRKASREAIDLFCYQVQKHTAALTVPLGGLDTLVFTGGIGENAPAIRAQICERLAHLGVRLDPRQNGRNARLISVRGAPVRVCVIPTDEESEIARTTFQVLDTIG
jgi:acetate kinase